MRKMARTLAEGGRSCRGSSERDAGRARVAPAPAAVADCLCALRWVATRAQNYGIDPARLVISGESAGASPAVSTTRHASLDSDTMRRAIRFAN